MLVLTRVAGESIRIGENILITVLERHGEHVRLGIEAPREITILRSELVLTCDVCGKNFMKGNGQVSEGGIICATCIERARRATQQGI